MKIKFLILLCAFLFPCGTYAARNDQTISSKNLSFSNGEDESNKVEELAKEIQNLLSRIEVLEHTVSNLNHQLEASKEAVSTNSTVVLPAKIAPENVESRDGDIFDLPAQGTGVEAASEKVVKPVITESGKEKQLYDLALAALKDNKLPEAEAQFATFIKNYPKSNLQSNAYFWYGETFFRRNIFDQAAINYLKGYKQFPKGAKASDSLLKLALSLGQLNKKADACSMIAKLEAEFPSRGAASIKRAKDAKIKFGCK